MIDTSIAVSSNNLAAFGENDPPQELEPRGVTLRHSLDEFQVNLHIKDMIEQLVQEQERS